LLKPCFPNQFGRAALLALLLVGIALSAVSCGYRLAGQANRLPADLKVIAIPAFENRTTLMRLGQRLTSAVMEEFIQRTNYRVVGTPGSGREAGADAVLRGTVLTARSTPLIFDASTGRASAVQITITIQVELRHLRRQQVLFSNPRYIFREQYEVSSDLDSFFDERNPALNRLARDFARTLVTAVLENF
jgi:hypothetical protein